LRVAQHVGRAQTGQALNAFPHIGELAPAFGIAALDLPAAVIGLDFLDAATFSARGSAAAIRQADSTEGTKIRAALEDLKGRIPGVVSTYEQPFTKTDHEAVTASMVTMGEVRQGIITFAYKEDEKAAIIGRKRVN